MRFWTTMIHRGVNVGRALGQKTATQQPVFTQIFPNINFNPAAGTVPGNTSAVTSATRPFTAVITNPAGQYAGTIAAQSDSAQAGVGSLYSFSAVFTGSFQVPAAGQATFAITSDDGFVFGIGNGAARVSGPQDNVPAATVLQGYAVMGGRNQRLAPAVSTIVVSFPAAGTYPYELDYTKGYSDNQLTLTLQSGGVPIPAATLLTLSPSIVLSTTAGQIRTFSLTATDGGGMVVPNLPITVTVTGINGQSRPLTTDGTGQASFSYAGSPLLTGLDQIQATATVNGAAVTSNLVTLAWNSGANQAPAVSAGAPQTLSLPNPAVLDGVVSDDGLPNNTLTSVWSMVSGPAAVTFDNPNQAATAVSFTAAGTYVLQLSASDGALTSTAQVTITVNPNPTWETGWLATPLDKSTVTVPTDVTLVSGITLTSGTLKYYPASDPVNGSDPSGLLVRQWGITVAVGEALYATTVQVLVYGGAAYDAYYIGRYTTVGRDFICILKSATSAALAASELEQGYFGRVLDAYANGCRVPAYPIPGLPTWLPRPGPTSRPKAPIDQNSKPKPRRPDNCPDRMPEHHIASQPNYEIWKARIEALSSGYPSVLTVCRVCASTNRDAWNTYRRTRPDLVSAPKEEIDEYPYATTVEGGIVGGVYPFLKRVNARQNGSEGRSWGWSIFGVPDGCRVRIVIDP